MSTIPKDDYVTLLETALKNRGLATTKVQIVPILPNGASMRLENKTLIVDMYAARTLSSDELLQQLDNVLLTSVASPSVRRLLEKCPVCGKIAKEVSRTESTGLITITLDCFHVISRESDSKSNFDSLVFDGLSSCSHNWAKTVCTKCNAKKLYPYQIEGARFLERSNGRAAIFDEMGLGKTIQALAYLKFNREVWPFLWVTKSGIKYQHAQEITRVLGIDTKLFVVANSKAGIYPGFDCYVLSYDIFRKLDLSLFKKIGIKTIVLDEVQAIKNPESSRTQAICDVVRELPHIIPLSGTPWKNRGNELFVVLNMLDPRMFYEYSAFTKNHCEIYYEGNKTKVGGIKNPAEFREKIAHLAIRRERKEVMPELPLVNRMSLTTELDGASRQVYDEELKALKELMNQAKLEGLDEDKKFKAAARAHIMVMRHIVGLAKIGITNEFIEEFLTETDRKLLVGYHHIDVGNLLFESARKICSDNSLPEPLILRGSSSPEDRFRYQTEFNKSGRLMFLSTLASGEGLNLQTCSDMLIHERQWNAANEEQLEGRMIRIGQLAESVNCTYVHAKNTVDLDFDSIVEGKRVSFDNLMNKDGYANTWNEESVLDSLLERLMK